jgi:predicted DsbA family dithiol-disulfide isomerase
LHWAGLEGKQLPLKQALFGAYFTDGADPSDHTVLARIAAQVGLDPARSQEILASDEYAAEVRAREEFYRSQGINAVPAVIVNDRHLIEGGQPVAVFERVLRQLADSVSQPA